MSEEDKNLPYLYWTPKSHKVPFKHHFIAGSSKCRRGSRSKFQNPVKFLKIYILHMYIFSVYIYISSLHISNDNCPE